MPVRWCNSNVFLAEGSGKLLVKQLCQWQAMQHTALCCFYRGPGFLDPNQICQHRGWSCRNTSYAVRGITLNRSRWWGNISGVLQQARRRAGSWLFIALPALSKGWKRGRKFLFITVSYGNFMFYQNQLETNLLQLFAVLENSEWFSI